MAIKICTKCGSDVSMQKRVKDAQGRYYCHPCWGRQANAPQKHLKSASTDQPPSDGELSLDDLMQLETTGRPVADSTPRLVRCSVCQRGFDSTQIQNLGGRHVCIRCGQSVSKSRPTPGFSKRYVVLAAGGVAIVVCSAAVWINTSKSEHSSSHAKTAMSNDVRTSQGSQGEAAGKPERDRETQRLNADSTKQQEELNRTQQEKAVQAEAQANEIRESNARAIRFQTALSHARDKLATDSPATALEDIKVAASLNGMDPQVALLVTELRNRIYLSAPYREERSFERVSDQLFRLAFSPDGKFVVASETDQVHVWSTEDGKCRLSFKLSGDGVSKVGGKPYILLGDIAVDPFNRFVVIQSNRLFFEAHSLKDGHLISKFGHDEVEGESHFGEPWFSLSSSGNFLVSDGITHVGVGSPIYIWDVEQGKLADALTRQDALSNAAISSDGKLAISVEASTGEPTLIVWDVASGKRRQTISVSQESPIHLATFIPNTTNFVTAGEQAVQVWSTDTEKCILKIATPAEMPQRLICLQDGKSVFEAVKYVNKDQKFDVRQQVFDLSNGRCLDTLDGVISGAISLDRQHVLKWAKDWTPRLWTRSITNKEQLDAIAFCDQFHNGQSSVAVASSADIESRWRNRAEKGTAAMEDRERIEKRDVQQKALEEKDRRDSDREREEHEDGAEMPRGIAKRICESMKQAKMIESAEFVDYFWNRGFEKAKMFPSIPLTTVGVHFKFTFVTEAGLLRVHEGYIAFENNGKWRPAVVNVDGLAEVPAARFVRKE